MGQPFRLMDLPIELRIAIHEYLVIDSEPILTRIPNPRPITTKTPHASVQSPSCRLAQPAITRTSRQLRREALPIFYGKNIFRDEDWDRTGSPFESDFVIWLDRIGKQNRQLLRHIELHACGHAAYGFYKNPSTMLRLQRLSRHLAYSTPPLHFDDIFGVLRIHKCHRPIVPGYAETELGILRRALPIARDFHRLSMLIARAFERKGGDLVKLLPLPLEKRSPDFCKILWHIAYFLQGDDQK
ncbi:MAG: hypothetical protein M1820_000111 [Bogoriella megaspora]|nr:MAG: hypothetical protein M1820_000111 [Bogoriella megaspora]